MSKGPGNLSIFLTDLKRRGVTRLASIYAVTGLGTIEAFDIISGRFVMPDWTMKLLIIVFLVGFPVTLVLGWIYDITSKGVVKTEALTQSEVESLPSLRWKPSWLTLVLFLFLLLITTAFFVVPRPNALGFKQQDWILIADLENNTGEEIFDNTLLHALTLTIDQSKRINVFPRTQVENVLRRMQMDSVKKIDLPVALEVAEREHIKGVLLFTISEIGGSYVQSTRLINPYNGETIRTSQETARGLEEVLPALDKLARKVRKDLGESLQNIHIQDLPLYEATTRSLEALKLLTRADNVTGGSYYNRQKELLHEAIKLDPEFALAHSNLAAYYYWTNDRENGEKHINIALSLLDRLTEKERLWIQAAVEGYRGNREASVVRWGNYLDKYPNSYGGWYRLGYNYLMLGREEESISAFTRALEIYNDDDPGALINIATCHSKMGNYKKAIEYYEEAFSINTDWQFYPRLNHEYGFTYVVMGKPEKAEAIFHKLLLGEEDLKAQGKRSLGLLYMYQGKYEKALNLMHESMILYKSLGNSLGELRNRLFICKIYEARGMIEEYHAELDHCYSMITDVATEPWWYLLLGRMLVRNGQIEEAETIVERVADISNEGNKRDESAYFLLTGEIELEKGNFEKSLELLETGTVLDQSSYTLESLGYYYLSEHNWGKAIETYSDLIGKYPILGWEGQECWVHAHFYLANAFFEFGDFEKATEYYGRLLSIWKDGDQDLPELKIAKLRASEPATY